MDERKKALNEQQKFLTTVFGSFVNKNLVRQDQFHSFCRWAKPKGRGQLMMMVDLGKRPEI